MDERMIRAIAILCANVRIINVQAASEKTIFKLAQTYREYIETGKVPT